MGIVRRVSSVAAKVIVAVVLIVAIVVVVLRLTNPDPRSSDGWTERATMPDERGEVASAVVGDRLVVMGGLRGAGTTSDAVSVYDTGGRWRRGDRLPAGRHHAAAAADDAYVYLSGGAASATDWTAADDLWRAEPGGSWEDLATMPEGRQSHDMVHVDGKLYVVGGVGPGGRDGDTLVYDIAGDSWERLGPLPSGRDHLRAVAVGRHVWAIGGRAGGITDRVDILDTRSGRWRRGPDLPVAMSAMGVGAIDGAIHVVGGEDPHPVTGGVIDEHFVLPQGADAWEDAPLPALPVHGPASGVLDGRLVITGGASRQGAFSTLSWTGVTQVFDPGDERD